MTPVRPRRRRLLSLLPILLLPGAISARPSTVRINEIRPIPFDTPSGSFEYGMVELYNISDVDQPLSSFALQSGTGASLVDLTGLIIPAGNFLTVVFGSGLDDLDFSDSAGTVHSPIDSITPFDPTFDECALYAGPPGMATIVDYVGWSFTGVFTGGPGYSHALAAGIWTSGDFVDYPDLSVLSTIGRCPDGLDRDHPVDWREFDWTAHIRPGGHELPSNTIQTDPVHGELLYADDPVLRWNDVAGADSFFLEVDTDSLFSAPIVALTTTDSAFAVSDTIPDDVYFWRVRAFVDGALFPRGVVWSFLKHPDAAPERSDGSSNIVRRIHNFTDLRQRKDTKLLCVWNERGPDHRPGCDRDAGAQGPWDDSHPQQFSHIHDCKHCNMNCTRASIAMINRRYFGNLSQDRIAFEMFHDRTDGPEGDLGHNKGPFLAERTRTLRWALGLGVGDIARTDGKPSWATVRAEVLAGRPVLIDGTRHTTVLKGIREITVNGKAVTQVIIADPWYRHDRSINHSTWICDRRGWAAKIPGTPHTAGVFKITNPAAIDEFEQESSVTTDTDGDSIVDFDEGGKNPQPGSNRPRKFETDHLRKDTDHDQVPDKSEIAVYTFYDDHQDTMANEALTFPDIDGDGLRGEADCNADHDESDDTQWEGNGHWDGGEDIDGDGRNREAGETAMYDKTSRRTDFTVLIEPAGVDSFFATMSGRRMHKDWGYSAATFPRTGSCDDATPDAGDSLTTTSVVISDENGVIFEDGSILGFFAAGKYISIIDVAENGVYDPGCDIVRCFSWQPPTSTVGFSSVTASGGELSVTLRWSVDAPNSFTGMHVWRSEDPSREFRRITDSPIPNDGPSWPSENSFEDRTGTPGKVYYYKLEVVYGENHHSMQPKIYSAVAAGVAALRAELLSPNPAVGNVRLSFAAPLQTARLRIAAYDVLGRHVADLFDERPGGDTREISWDGRDDRGEPVSSGIYLIRIEAGGASRVLRTIMLR